MTFKANSKDDLNRLSMALCALPQWFVLAHVHDLGLMRCRQQPLAFTIYALRKMRGTTGMLNFFNQLKTRSPDVVNDWFADTLQHMHFGRDTEDKDSAGGWSQREIDLLVERIPGLNTWSAHE